MTQNNYGHRYSCNFRKSWLFFLVLNFIFFALSPIFSHADSEDEVIVALGADQTPYEQAQELQKFGVSKQGNEATDNQTGQTVRIIFVTNQDERALLSNRFSSIIGSRALSGARIDVGTNKKNDIVVGPNITRITNSMYASALVTAGVQNAKVQVDAPRPVSGTGALAGILKAFEIAQGKSLDPNRKKSAAEELSLISQLNQNNDPNKTVEFFTLIKKSITENDPKSYEDYKTIVVTIANQLNIQLSPQLLESTTQFAQGFGYLHLDWASLWSQFQNMSGNLKDIFDVNRLQDLTGVSIDASLIDKILNFIQMVFTGILNLLKDILNYIFK